MIPDEHINFGKRQLELYLLAPSALRRRSRQQDDFPCLRVDPHSTRRRDSLLLSFLQLKFHIRMLKLKRKLRVTWHCETILLVAGMEVEMEMCWLRFLNFLSSRFAIAWPFLMPTRGQYFFTRPSFPKCRDFLLPWWQHTIRRLIGMACRWRPRCVQRPTRGSSPSNLYPRHHFVKWLCQCV